MAKRRAVDATKHGTLERWPKLRGMVMCRATRTDNGETSVEDGYFITSCANDDVAVIAGAVRSHWGIENGLHWVLDVAFLEDQSHATAWLRRRGHCHHTHDRRQRH